MSSRLDKHLQNLSEKVNILLTSPALTTATRKALKERVEKANGSNRFFPDESFQVLSIVCDRLFDQEPENRMFNPAIFIDDRLAEKKHDGWRYSDLPPDRITYQKGIEGINETAGIVYQKNFLHLNKEEQVKILSLIQQENAPGKVWKEMPSGRFFEELLAEATEIFFSYPSVQIEMDYTGMADAPGWQKIGLNEKDTPSIPGIS